MKVLIALSMLVAVVLAGTLLSTWFVTMLLGAGFQTLGIDGPGWQTVFWFVLAGRAALAGVNVRTKT